MRRVLFLAAIVGGCGRPAQDPAMKFAFAAYGDCRKYDEVHTDIAKSMVAAGPKFVLVTGDLVDFGDNEAMIERWRAITKDLRAASEYVCARGDHDGEKLVILRRELKMEKLFYDRVFGDIHVFVLDSCQKFAEAEQLKWLEETATASTSKHKIAVFHHSPFLIYENRMEQAAEIRAAIHPVLVRLKFCAAMCGHQHAFYTTVRDGVRYVVTAGGGAPLAGIDASLGAPGDLARRMYHWVGFNEESGKINGTVVDRYGQKVPELGFTLCEHK